MGVALAAIAQDSHFLIFDDVDVAVTIIINAHDVLQGLMAGS
jgi:hypothetical protein